MRLPPRSCAPESGLAYQDFDGTFDSDEDSGSYKGKGIFVHEYALHVEDWRAGDPTWKGGKGYQSIGRPPSEPDKDWVALVKR